MDGRSSPFSAAGAAMIMNKSSKVPPTLTLENVSPATRLLEKRRQMFEVQEALDAQKEEFARREDAFGRREDRLRKKDLELQESLIKFNKFLQENESKRNRAVKRASEEVKQRELKERELEDLHLRLQQLQDESDRLRSKVQKNIKYMKYLESVQESVPEDYPEIADLVNRYRTLMETNRDLSQNQVTQEDETERKRSSLAFFQKERANEILMANNKIAALQRDRETEELRSMKMQHEADASLRQTTQKTLALGQIIMAIENLVQRCTSGVHGQILKHMDGCKSAAVENTSMEDNANGNGTQQSLLTGVSESDILHQGQNALVDLDAVAAYMLDFTAIVQYRLEMQRASKKGNAHAPMASTNNNVEDAKANTNSKQ